jgi:hypothetical protein
MVETFGLQNAVNKDWNTLKMKGHHELLRHRITVG